MRRTLAAITAVALMLICLNACMYSKTIIIEDSIVTKAADPLITIEATGVNPSPELIKYIGVDELRRVISLNEDADGTYISAAKVTDNSLQTRIIERKNIVDATLANHGKNILYRVKNSGMIEEYSYSVDTEDTIQLFFEPESAVKTTLFASEAVDTVTEVFKPGKYFFANQFDLNTGKTIKHILTDDKMDEPLKILADAMTLGEVFIDDSYRLYGKADAKNGSFLISLKLNGNENDIIAIESSSLGYYYSGGIVYYIDGNSRLMALNSISQTERKLAENVRCFAVSADNANIAYVSSKNGSDKLYVSCGGNSSPEMLDVRQGISSLKFSADGRYLIVEYLKKGENKPDYLIYYIRYRN